MAIEHYIAGLLVIAVLNLGGRRYASQRANKLAFLATAASPIVLSAGLMAFLIFRDGPAIFQDPYLSTLLMVIGAMTVLTSASALLGQVLGRPSKPEL